MGLSEEVFISRSFPPGALAAREKFRQALRRWPFFKPKETVVAAVSGGVDSVVLLHLLAHLPEALRPRLIVAHFHHGLRGRASDGDARFVRRLAKQKGITIRVGRAPKWKNRNNLESRARELRYRFLESVAIRHKAKTIAVAHHADDQLETFTMRWLQGAGLKGLAGIRSMRAFGKGKVLIRPLLGVSRREIEAYAKAFDLSYRNDETNQSDQFLRSRLRKLLNRLKKENPNLTERTFVNSIFLRADDDELERQVTSIFEKLSKRTPRRVSFPLVKYRLMSESRRYRLLQKAVQALHSDQSALPATAILKVDEILRDQATDRRSVFYDLPSGLTLEKTSESFVFSRKKG